MMASADKDLVLDVGNKLLALLTIEVNDPDRNPPKNIGFMPGNTETEDLSVYGDYCCEGTAFVQLNSVYPSGLDFPAPDTGQDNCSPNAWGSIWTLGIMRCAPVGDINFTPTMQQLGTANTQHLTDDASMRAVVLKYKNMFASGAGDAGVLMGTTNAVGPQGGCLMRTLSVTIQVIGCGVWENIE